jgi:radical SAM protein with 4Fe4S-binding SPASM domain
MSACREVTYGEFGDALNRAGLAARVPLAGSFELTFRCNLRCVHCYVPDYSGKGELATDEVTRILSEAADLGCLWMLLTGGEVLSRRDFPALYLHAKRLGLLITLYTNGTLLDERLADLLAEYPPFGVEITLYGLSDETYLRTTGAPRQFRRVRRAIDLLVERRLRLTLKAVAMEPLTGEIDAMRAFCARLGVPFRYDPIIHARLDGSLAPTRARPSPGTVVGYDASDPERLAEWLRYYRRFVRGAAPTPLLMSCGAGVNSFHVDPKGTLLSCEALPLNGFDLRRGSFREGWYGIVGDIRRRPAAAENVCAACGIRGLCDRCPATALLETGSPDGWVPYFCEVTHRRAALLEEAAGDEEAAARYRAHAEKVAAGWSPPGAILPRGRVAEGTAAACARGGGCAAGGCGAVAPTPELLRIERPGHAAGTSGRVVDDSRRA